MSNILLNTANLLIIIGDLIFYSVDYGETILSIFLGLGCSISWINTLNIFSQYRGFRTVSY